MIQVDLSSRPASVTLDHPEDCRRFHVRVRGGTEAALEEALARCDVGHVSESGHVMVEVAAVRRLAEGRVAGSWTEQFSGLLSYADSKGWLDDGGRRIRAHVEWAE